ncbi:MAG: hypothetical protein JWL62_3227, partial [Hyphomicrobiales bacterium]|nr:hypothetical protein [Hyphomicrobiales bacterium]
FAAELEAVGQKMYSEDNGVAPPPADDATDTEEASGTPTEISDPGP